MRFYETERERNQINKYYNMLINLAKINLHRSSGLVKPKTMREKYNHFRLERNVFIKFLLLFFSKYLLNV